MTSRESDFSMSDAPRPPTQAEHIAELRRLHREAHPKGWGTQIWPGAPIIAAVLARVDELEAELAMKTSYEARLTADDRLVPLYYVKHLDGSFSPSAPQPVAAPAPAAVPDVFARIGAELASQDNAITAHPLFVVFEKQRCRIDKHDPASERFVTACFTRKGAEDYLAVNGHNLRDPFIYVASAWRNKEMIELREAMLAAGTSATQEGK